MITKKLTADIYNCSIDSEVLTILLMDRSTGTNIRWCTDDYAYLGAGFGNADTIEIELVSGMNAGIIKPRADKEKVHQQQRSREKGEVFTPSWVCNAQNNLIDNAWFGIERKRFNTEVPNGWVTNYYPISFREAGGKKWEDYVMATRLEVSCGEAPYITSRYDTVSGKYIPVRKRIGLLDRKLRIISENVDDRDKWKHWAIIALQSIYGYDWQGDNVLLARKNLIYSVIEAYCDRFSEIVDKNTVLQFAEIISWNIWQMDGIKFVVPNTCHQIIKEQIGIFEITQEIEECCGCKTCNPFKHNGIYCCIKDWRSGETILFADMLKGAKV